MAIITISRAAKSGGIALAEALSARLGYTCLSREILLESARRYNIDEEILQREMSRPPSFWQRLTRERNRYLVFIRCSLLRAAQQDNLIYHGHAGQLFLEGLPHVLKLRIEAPLEQRVAVVCAEQNIERDAALAHIRRIDEERRRWVSFLYDREWTDPALYDLTINLARITIDSACELVCKAIERPELLTTAAATKALADRSLACEVKAALVADDQLWDQELEVSATDGTVAVSGTVQSTKQQQAVAKLVPLVKGVSQCQLHLRVTSDPLPSGAPWKD